MSESVRTSLPIEYPEEQVYSISDLGEGLALRNRRTVELTPAFAAHTWACIGSGCTPCGAVMAINDDPGFWATSNRARKTL